MLFTAFVLLLGLDRIRITIFLVKSSFFGKVLEKFRITYNFSVEVFRFIKCRNERKNLYFNLNDLQRLYISLVCESYILENIICK